MANTFVKASRIVTAALALLEREIILPSVVWKDAFGDFAGAAGDTISVRIPSYATARTRVLRSATPYTIDQLSESTISLTLDTDVYKAVGVTDEELTLDVASFTEQVMTPVVHAVARGVEDALAAKIAASTPFVSLTMDATDPYKTLIDARKALNDAQVPQSGRYCIVGSAAEAAMLKSDHLSRFDGSGDTSALRDAIVGKLGGFTVLSAGPQVDPKASYAFHSTAYALSMRAPAIPDGVGWGASESFGGLSMRVIRDYDFTNIRDRLLANVYIGTGIVNDTGYTDANGVFVPAEATPGTAATITSSTGAVVTNSGTNGFVAGDRIVFTSIVGPTNLVVNRTYYVLAASLAATTFTFAATVGGAPITPAAVFTGGSVRTNGSAQFVRSVKMLLP